MQYDFFDRGIATDDGFFDDGRIYLGIVPDGNVGTNYRVCYGAAFCDTNGMDDDGIFEVG